MYQSEIHYLIMSHLIELLHQSEMTTLKQNLTYKFEPVYLLFSLTQLELYENWLVMLVKAV